MNCREVTNQAQFAGELFELTAAQLDSGHLGTVLLLHQYTQLLQVEQRHQVLKPMALATTNTRHNHAIHTSKEYM